MLLHPRMEAAMAGNSPGAGSRAPSAARSDQRNVGHGGRVPVHHAGLDGLADAASAAEPLTDIVKCGTPHIRHWELGLVLPGQMRA